MEKQNQTQTQESDPRREWVPTWRETWGPLLMAVVLVLTVYGLMWLGGE